MPVVELRCPQPAAWDSEHHPGRLLARLVLDGGRPSFVQPDNLIEMACSDCKRHLARSGRQARRVLHRYDFAGGLVETLVEEPGEDAGPGSLSSWRKMTVPR
jgi:hypothetical protein